MKYLFFLFFICSQVSSIYSQSANIHFQIVDKSNGELTPARLTILEDGKPVTLNLESKLNIATRNNVIYTASGTGTFSLKPGDYDFWFSRGMEYSVDVQKIHIENEKEYFLSAYLEKAINTDGFICGDLHLHTLTNSGHGDANLIERVISCAAEGLEWIVATDHNFVTDYQPYLEKGGIKNKLKTSVGNEVSTSIGHFNIFPLDKDDEPVDTKTKDAKVLFKNIRLDAGEEVLIQVNHPREVTPFFSLRGLDPFFGTINNPEWSWDFDAFEVLNANGQTGWIKSPVNLQSVVRDWYNIFNHNIRITGLGNSDSHTVMGNFAGVPRNYIRSKTDKVTEINEDELTANIKAQQVVVACGLFPRILVNGKDAMGSTFSAANQAVNLQLQVQAAPWVDCSRVELIRNGITIRSFNLENSQATKGAIRFDTIVSLKPQKDSWYLLVAHGAKDMYPIVGTLEKPSYPSGFTNPVWIKANTNKNFQSLFGLARIKIEEKGKYPAELVSLLEKEPEYIPSVFYHLFNDKHSNALKIAEVFFSEANTENRLMLFRELAKTDLPGAQSLLEKFQHEKMNAYEAVSLASFIHFPIRNSRVTQFKQRKKAHLDDYLNFLETEFSYIHSKGLVQKAEVGYNTNETLPEAWEEIVADQNAVFYFPEKENGFNYLKTNWRMIKDTSLTFYLNTNKAIQVFINGKQVQKILPNTKDQVAEKLIDLPLGRGSNEIVLQFSAKENGEISFYHANNAMLIDPALELEEVKHLAVNASTKYLTKYNYKYHGHDVALTDGYRGTKDYSNQLWQGWFGEKAEIVVDLGEVKSIQEISVGLLESQGPWIFFPKKIEYFSSVDGFNFTTVYKTETEDIVKNNEVEIKTLSGKIKPQKSRFVKVVLTPIDALPEWHESKGENAWIFLDEIIVK